MVAGQRRDRRQASALARRQRRFHVALARDLDAQALRARTLPADHPEHVATLVSIALDRLGAGAPRKARTTIEKALAGLASPTSAQRWVHAQILWATGDRARDVALAVQRDATGALRDEVDAWLAGRR